MSPRGDADWPTTLYLADETATRRLGAGLAEILAVGDVVALSGELGTGKTSLARAIIQTLAGDNVEVPSPTFTLVQDYPDLSTPIVHFDLYRLRDQEELIEIGFDEADDEAAVLVEWPERAGSLLPAAALTIALALAGEGRRAILSGGGNWQRRLEPLKQQFDS
jgi:tRNA threonylcarbamoyl adenosine modification protein YjeE